MLPAETPSFRGKKRKRVVQGRQRHPMTVLLSGPSPSMHRPYLVPQLQLSMRATRNVSLRLFADSVGELSNPRKP